MNERVKAARKALSLNQSEFGGRLGVTPTAISKIEGGERGLTDQMILAMCKEYSINETWLRTGDGEMFVVSENALIRQLSEQYNLDALDRKILEIYVALPEAHKQVFKGFALKLADAASAVYAGGGAALDMEAAEEIAPDDGGEWQKGLTEEEAVALLRQRYADAKKGSVLSSTLGKAGNE
jgi:transcriptional regulator with XRE-family HTH domain